MEATRLAVGALVAARGESEPEDAEAATAFLLRDGPEGIPDGLPHEALRILSVSRQQAAWSPRFESWPSVSPGSSPTLRGRVRAPPGAIGARGGVNSPARQTGPAR